MKPFALSAMLAAGLLALAACSGSGGNVEQSYDNRVDALDAQADNLQAQADNLRDDMDQKEAALENSDAADAAAMNAGLANAH